MSDTRDELMKLSREQLITRATELGVARPRTLANAELLDEILAQATADPHHRRSARGWLGLARDLLKSVVDRGLHLPESAGRAIKRATEPPPSRAPRTPYATLTLAEIYERQGHTDRAIAVLNEVLARSTSSASSPDDAAPNRESHVEALALHQRLTAKLQAKRKGVIASEPAVSRADSLDTTATTSDDALAALDERYDVDEVVAIAVDPTTVYLYWEVRPVTLASARSQHPHGRLTVRAIAVNADHQGPSSDARDLPVDALFGDVYVGGLRPAANVRVSIGWKWGDGMDDFDPFAVGPELSTPQLTPAPTTLDISSDVSTPHSPASATATAVPTHTGSPDRPVAWVPFGAIPTAAPPQARPLNTGETRTFWWSTSPASGTIVEVIEELQLRLGGASEALTQRRRHLIGGASEQPRGSSAQVL